jgi:two-component system, NtrC family, sensor kinase
MGRALEGRVVHIVDVLADPEFTHNDLQEIGGFRTTLGVPLLRDGFTIGALALTRSEVRSFTDQQIELLKTFADQAVIAIENTRLFEAEQASKRELQESLERQTTTADVLKIISRSTFDLKKIFETTAVRLSGQ